MNLQPLKLRKETIISLNRDAIVGGAPLTESCYTCPATCTLDGTKASKYVSNCCASQYTFCCPTG